jgi:hypothetical protein
VLFLDRFRFKSFQKYVVQQLSVQYPTDGFFEKLTVVEVICLNFQRFQDFIWAFSPSSCRAFRGIIPPDLHQLEVQWWIFYFILQTSWLKDFNLRIIRFKLCKLKWLKFFSLWFPASGDRSRSSTNLALCTDLSLSLAFSGSAGFGTLRILVPLSISCFTNFWLFGLLVHTSLYSCYFWFLEFSVLDFIYSIYPCPVETSMGSIL